MNSTGTNPDSGINRPPAVAGSFYPGQPHELEGIIKNFFASAVKPKSNANVRALISPHAGYVFSGQVAASAFNQLNPEMPYKLVFLIGSSHRMSFDGAAVYAQGNYITPFGEVKVDRDLSLQLKKQFPDLFLLKPEAHLNEHSLEVQLPFLQRMYGDELKIVPIVLGTQRAETCKKIAAALKSYFLEENLFVISTDFSHYPSYKDAQRVDKETLEAICSNDSKLFLTSLKKHEEEQVGNLATSICGWTSTLTLLEITGGQANLHYLPVQYMNSGDSKYGEKDRVVGYHAIVVSSSPEKSTNISSDQKETFFLSENDKKELIRIARNTLQDFIRNNSIPKIESSGFSSVLQEPCGAFMTLRKNGELRGCIGQFNASDPLWRVVQHMTISSSTRDSRFFPVSAEELPELEIEISVLTPMRKIYSVEEIIPGKHGIYIKNGNRSGTFLPQVATETGWSVDELLGHCARDKAGLGWDGWKSADIYIYEAIIIKE